MMTKNIFLACLFVVGFFTDLRAQIVLPLGNEQTLRFDAKRVCVEANNDLYVRETADTLYFYDHNKISQTVREVRIPLRFFDKQNKKQYKAEVRLNKNVGGKFYVNFRACASNLTLSKGNRFSRLYHGYREAVANDDYDVQVSIYFDNKAEAQAFLKRTQESIKKLN